VFWGIKVVVDKCRFPFGILTFEKKLRGNDELGGSTRGTCVLSGTILTGLDLSLHVCLVLG